MSISIQLLLAAIASVETGSQANPDLAIGHAGERGRFQLSQAVWEQHAKDYGVLPGDFAADASDPVIAASRAEAHLLWLTKQLEAHGRPVTVETLAEAWRSPAATFAGHATAGVKDYAQRVANLYDDAAKSAPPRVPVPEHLSSP